MVWEAGGSRTVADDCVPLSRSNLPEVCNNHLLALLLMVGPTNKIRALLGPTCSLSHLRSGGDRLPLL